MALKEKPSFIAVLAVLLIFQSIDAYQVKADPMQLLYLFNATFDYAIFVAILILSLFSVKTNRTNYIQVLLLIQVVSIGVHLGALFSEITYQATGLELYAIVNDYYSPLLIAIFVLKMWVLVRGGYGIFKRSKHKRAINIDNPGLIIVRSTGVSENSLREQVRF